MLRHLFLLSNSIDFLLKLNNSKKIIQRTSQSISHLYYFTPNKSLYILLGSTVKLIYVFVTSFQFSSSLENS